MLIDALWTDPTIRLVEFHRMIAFEARDLVRQGRFAGWNLRSHDAIHLATARRAAAREFQTYDARLFKFGALVGIPVGEPRVS